MVIIYILFLIDDNLDLITIVEEQVQFELFSNYKFLFTLFLKVSFSQLQNNCCYTLAAVSVSSITLYSLANLTVVIAISIKLFAPSSKVERLSKHSNFYAAVNYRVKQALLVQIRKRANALTNSN